MIRIKYRPRPRTRPRKPTDTESALWDKALGRFRENENQWLFWES
jgi:hypothetical protein